jgi:hypothetical protein
MEIAQSASAIGEDSLVPCITVSIWLKPFDLGVSQQLVISLPKYALSGQFTANIALRHLSGTRESWLRLNHSFVSNIRRHFLHWRVVREDEREELLHEAVEKLGQKTITEAAG